MRSPGEEARPLVALGLLAALAAAAVGLALTPWGEAATEEAGRRSNQRLVSELGLTDLALWSEASYCRHPSQADFFAAWADHPLALEHFPAGSIVPPPARPAPSAGAERRDR